MRKSFEEKNEHQDQDLLNNMLAQHPDPPQKIVSDFLSPTDHLPESTKGRLSLKQDKNMKVRFHGEKREYVGTLFLGGQPAGTQQGDFCVTWKGGVRWITGDTVPLHFRNPITVLGGVREGGVVSMQDNAGQGKEERGAGHPPQFKCPSPSNCQLALSHLCSKHIFPGRSHPSPRSHGVYRI